LSPILSFKCFSNDFRGLSFYLAFGIENLSQINTELKEILAASVRIDAIVTYDDDFDFTKLRKRIFPWFGNYLSQTMPKIAVATPEKFMVVWADARNKDTDSNIYGRIFQISGDSAVPAGEDFRIPGDGWPWKSVG
jgi:hypothetical protein